MALTDTRHDSSADTVETRPGDSTEGPLVALDRLFGAGDHKAVGRLWLVCSTLFLLGGGVVSLLAAIEHVDLGGLSLSPDAAAFAQLWSLGRELLILGGVVPLFVGLAVYVVPLQVGSPSLAFPRGAAAAFWIWLMASILLIVWAVSLTKMASEPLAWTSKSSLACATSNEPITLPLAPSTKLR